jgi:hypothetical protein
VGVPKMAPRTKEEKIKDVSNVFKNHKIDGPGANVRFETRSWVQGVPKIFVRSNFEMLEEVFETVSNIGFVWETINFSKLGRVEVFLDFLLKCGCPKNGTADEGRRDKRRFECFQKT